MKKPKNTNKTSTIRMSEETQKSLRFQHAIEGRSMSAIFSDALALYINDYKARLDKKFKR